MRDKILKIAISIGENIIEEIDKYGFVLPGNNGPYNDPETPVRNMCHSVFILDYLYKNTEKSKYQNYLVKIGDYLLSNEVRPYNQNVFLRKNNEKDKVNGVIGPAWYIEALIRLYEIFGEDKYLKVAEEIFLLHTFDEIRGIWYSTNLKGEKIKFDKTFNHQLWFAMAGTYLSKYSSEDKVYIKLKIFFDKLDSNLSIHKTGLIRHPIFLNNTFKEKAKSFLIKSYYKYHEIFKKRTLRYKEYGYHLFNVYAFAVIKQNGWEIDFFKSIKMEKILDLCLNNNFYSKLEKNENEKDVNSTPIINNDLEVNRYGYPYNAPGFELPVIIDTFFNDNSKIKEQIMNRQFSLTYDQKSGFFTKNIEDLKILNYRIYELLR
ncbi:MAG: hypothetical protein ACOCUI_02990 [bacterium]